MPYVMLHSTLACMLNINTSIFSFVRNSTILHITFLDNSLHHCTGADVHVFIAAREGKMYEKRPVLYAFPNRNRFFG